MAEEDCLAQKILQDLEVTLIGRTIRFLFSFNAQADGMPDDTMMETRCYGSDFEGILRPTARVTKLHWLYCCDSYLTTESGGAFLQTLWGRGISW